LTAKPSAPRARRDPAPDLRSGAARDHRFPTDLPGTDARTRTGAVHLLLAGVAFAASRWAASSLRRGAGGQPALGWLASAGAIGTWLALRIEPLRPALGVVERVFDAALLAWLALVPARLV
jgi:hypothetical protein